MSKNRLDKHELARRTAQNETLKCSVEGCTDRRHAMSSYCRNHREKNRRNGAPTALAIRPNELAPYEKIARKFLRFKADHPAIIAAIKWADEWLQSAALGEKHVPAQRFMQAAYDRNVSGFTIIARVLAVYLYHSYQSRRLDGGMPLRHAVGKYILNLAKLTYTSPAGKTYPTKQSARNIREAGDYCLSTLAKWLINASRAIEEERQDRIDRVRALDLPIEADVLPLEAPVDAPSEDETPTTEPQPKEQ